MIFNCEKINVRLQLKMLFSKSVHPITFREFMLEVVYAPTFDLISPRLFTKRRFSTEDYTGFRIPIVTGQTKKDLKRILRDKETKDYFAFLSKSLNLPGQQLAMVLCQQHPPILTLIKDRANFEVKISHLMELGITKDRLIEAPSILSVDEASVRKCLRLLTREAPSELEMVGAHPRFLIPSTNEASRLADFRLFAETVFPYATNAEFMSETLKTSKKTIYQLAEKSFAILERGFRYGAAIEAHKAQGLSPAVIIKHWSTYSSMRSTVLNERLELLSRLQPHVAEDVMDSGQVFASSHQFSIYYTKALRKILVQDFPPSIHQKVAFVAEQLEVPQDLVLDFVEVYDSAAKLLCISEKKIQEVIRFLKDSGFSGPEIFRHHSLFGASLYNIGRAIHFVRVEFDLNEDRIDDCYLEAVAARVARGRVSREYNLVSRFSLGRLAEILDTTSDSLQDEANVWTRGKFNKFLNSAVVCLEEKKKEENDNNEDDGLEVRESPVVGKRCMSRRDDYDLHPWATIEDNVNLLTQSGFSKISIRKCLFCLLFPTESVRAAIFEVGDNSDRTMSIREQIRRLNLIGYRLERKQGSWKSLSQSQ